jgi:acetyl esterase/lipase
MRYLLALSTTLFVFGPALAGPMPSDKAEAIRAMGPVINPAETGKLYAPQHAKEPYEDVTVARDFKYGPHERNLLDVFHGAAPQSRPVLIFVHGGGYQRGDRRIGTSPYHDNLMLWASKNGLVGVNMTYRLAPDHSWPAAADDVAAAVAWTKEKIRNFGGDPDRILLMGHSAGRRTLAAISRGRPRLRSSARSLYRERLTFGPKLRSRDKSPTTAPIPNCGRSAHPSRD